MNSIDLHRNQNNGLFKFYIHTDPNSPMSPKPNSNKLPYMSLSSPIKSSLAPVSLVQTIGSPIVGNSCQIHDIKNQLILKKKKPLLGAGFQHLTDFKRSSLVPSPKSNTPGEGKDIKY